MKWLLEPPDIDIRCYDTDIICLFSTENSFVGMTSLNNERVFDKRQNMCRLNDQGTMWQRLGIMGRRSQ